MSRRVRRVPLDFDWTLGEVWQGYLMPDRLDEAPCPNGAQCVNGTTPARAWVEKIAQLALMLDDDCRAQQRERPMHPYFDSVPRPHATGTDLFAVLRGEARPAPRPSADIAEFGTGLAGRESGFLGHDALNNMHATHKIIAAAGLDPDTWGICPTCHGHATVEAYPGQRAEAEAWERTDPPTGEGWQLWETTTEGSPISTVFPTAEQLAQWLTTPEGDRAQGSSGRPMTIEQARGFVREGWAPTFVRNAGGVHDGAEFIGTEAALGDGE